MIRSPIGSMPGFSLRSPIAIDIAAIWTPAQLFADGQQGVWYEPKPEYLYQDAAGTTPVTADGDPVGLMLDLSGNGNHATQSTSAARPIYRTDGVLHWLEFDGVDDDLVMPSRSIVRDYFYQCAGVQKDAASSAPFFTTWRDSLFATYIRRSDAGYFDGALQGVELPTSPAKAVATWRLNSDANTGEQFENGELINVDTYNQVDSTGESYIGSARDSSYSKFSMWGLICVESAVNDEQKLQTEQYLAQKSGVTL